VSRPSYHVACRRRSTALIALFAATAALAGGTQALAPAPAAAVVQQGEECPKVDFIFFETCEEENGGGTTGPTGGATPGAGENPGSSTPAGDDGVPLDGKNEQVVINDTRPAPCKVNPGLCSFRDRGLVLVGDHDSNPRQQPRTIVPKGGKTSKKDPGGLVARECLSLFSSLTKADNDSSQPYVPLYQGRLEALYEHLYKLQHGMPGDFVDAGWAQWMGGIAGDVQQALRDWKEHDCESLLGSKLPVSHGRGLRRCGPAKWCKGYKPPRMPSSS
jgi:hypothetical protein